MTPRSSVVAALLSLLLPGLGQLYNGDRAKGIAMLCMALGIGVTVAVSHSVWSAILMGVLYIAVLIPASQDAYRVARGSAPSFAGERMWYVVWMLLCVGPFALPLLWQSRRFSTCGKVLWTIAVILIALVSILAVNAIGHLLDGLSPKHLLPK